MDRRDFLANPGYQSIEPSGAWFEPSLLIVLLLCSLSFVFSNQSSAQEPGAMDAIKNGSKQLSLEVENDSFLTTDRYYTNGIRLGYHAREHGMRAAIGNEEMLGISLSGDEFMNKIESRLSKKGVQLEGCAKQIDSVCLREIENHLPGFRAWATGYGIYLANNIYTGKNINLPVSRLPPNDHPYAGWTYLDFYKENTFFTDASDKYEISIGCIGPCSHSEQIQKWWHANVVNAPEPRGWDSQIGNELAIQTTYTKRWAPFASCGENCASESTRLFDLAPHSTIQLGNVFLTASVGGTARLQVYKMRGYFSGNGLKASLPKFVTLDRARQQLVGGGADGSDHDKLAEQSIKRGNEVFLFLRSEARLVGYNALIEGRMFGGPDPYSKNVKRVVMDSELGLAAYLYKVTFTASYAMRSTEVEQQPSELAQHRWLEFRIAWEFGGESN